MRTQKKTTKSNANGFSAARAKHHAAAIRKPARTTNAKANWKAPDLAVKRLRGAGIDNVRIETLPADGQGILRLAVRLVDAAEAALAKRGPAGRVAARHAVDALSCLQDAMPTPAMYSGQRTPEALYRQGVNRRTGLWPEVAQRQALMALSAPVSDRLSRREARAHSHKANGTSRRIQARAEALVPLSLKPGFLDFENGGDAAQQAELRARLDVPPDQAAPEWAREFAAACRGRATVRDIVDKLTDRGLAVELARAVALTDYGVKKGLMRLRPVLRAADIKRALRAAGMRRGMMVACHASLSRFGYIAGGAATFVAALRELLGPTGTLIMPTHSNSVLGAPPYDPATSPSNTGAVTEYFRRMPGVMRSAHPTHSVAAIGPAARELLAAHRVDQAPMARDGFWGRLCDLEGHVLLMCPMRSATLFHAGETWLNLPQAPLVAHALDPRGRRRTYVLPNGPWHVHHFQDTMAQPLIEQGVMTETMLGEAPLWLAPARAMGDISVEVNRQNPRVTIAKGGTCTCFYCQALRAGLT